jgi:hypothetical protein
MQPVYELFKGCIELARRMLIRWYVPVLTILISLLLAVSYTKRIGLRYTTVMSVMPAEMSRVGGNEINTPQSVLGIVIGGANPARMNLYLALLQSKTVARVLVDQDHIEKLLYRGALTDSGDWIETAASRRQRALYDLFGISLPKRPTIDDVDGTLKGLMLIKPSGVVTQISCTSSRPELCREVLLLAHQAAEATLNKLVLAQAERASEYLRNSLRSVPEIEVRTALATVLADAQRQIAMSSVGQPVGATILEQPIDPMTPSFPQPIEILTIAFLFGLVTGGAITWFTWEFRFNVFLGRSRRGMHNRAARLP